MNFLKKFKRKIDVKPTPKVEARVINEMPMKIPDFILLKYVIWDNAKLIQEIGKLKGYIKELEDANKKLQNLKTLEEFEQENKILLEYKKTVRKEEVYAEIKRNLKDTQNAIVSYKRENAALISELMKFRMQQSA